MLISHVGGVKDSAYVEDFKDGLEKMYYKDGSVNKLGGLIISFNKKST